MLKTRIASIASLHFRYDYMRHTQTHMPNTVARLCQLTGLMVSRLLLLSWCMAIAGYQDMVKLRSECGGQVSGCCCLFDVTDWSIC